MENRCLFFDHASTTRCCPEVEAAMAPFHAETYGNPSSAHTLGRKAAEVIRGARRFFAETFEVLPEQVIFTGSGTESDNLAITGIALGHSLRLRDPRRTLVTSSIEHAAVRNTIQSLSDFGFRPLFLDVDSSAQIDSKAFEELLASDRLSDTLLVSVMRVNNIVGSVLPVEELAKEIKKRSPKTVFHTDAIQAFTKVACPTSKSSVDLVSISGHKIRGPKGVGALIVLNRDLLDSNHLRPLIWGGGQEDGFRSGTESAAQICGFHCAAKEALSRQKSFHSHTQKLSNSFRKKLTELGLLSTSNHKAFLTWNSPENAVPHIISLSAPGYSGATLSKFLEKQNCLVSTGSACSSSQVGAPDAVLSAMHLNPSQTSSAIRVSFSEENSEADVLLLSEALNSACQFFRNLSKSS